jgi:pantetheine-phosphate adenylyltransferase
MSIAIFPGSFDPLTKGHLDIIKRASYLFDELIVTVASNTSKSGLFTTEERRDLIYPNIKMLSNVKVVVSNELTVDFAKKNGAKVIIRGLRNSSDFNSESSIAIMNKNLNDHIETLFLITDPKYQAISSSLVKEIAYFDGDISQYVPKNVIKSIKKKLNS